MVKTVYVLGGGVTGLAVAYELLKRGQKVEIIEKPEEYYLANTGVYLAESKIFKNLKKNSNSSFVDLIKICIKKKIRVGVYPVPESAWKDFGQSSEIIESNNV